MKTTLLIYIWGNVGKWQIALTILTLLSGAFSLISYVSSFECSKQDTRDLISSNAKKGFCGFCFLLISLLLLPTQAVIEKIAIAEVAQSVIDSKPIQRDLPELYDLALQSLKSELKKRVEPTAAQ